MFPDTNDTGHIVDYVCVVTSNLTYQVWITMYEQPLYVMIPEQNVDYVCALACYPPPQVRISCRKN